MKQTLKRTLCLLLVLCMALALTACGKKKTNQTPSSSTGSSVQTPATPAPAPPPEPETYLPDLDNLVDPEEFIDRYEKDGSNDYTHWYPNGDKLADFYLIFEDIYVIVRDSYGEEFYHSAIENGHIVTTSADDPAMDIVFIDNMTCYDLVNDQWYMSADYDQALASLTATTFCNTDGGMTWDITFYEDGSYYWRYGADDDYDEGSWWFSYAHEIVFTTSYGQSYLDVYYAPDSWEIAAVGYGKDIYYPLG